MRTLNEHELKAVSGANASLRPVLSEVVKSALPIAVDAAVGGAVGLVTRNVLGISNHGVEEVIGYAVSGGVAAFGTYVTTAICKDPSILTR
ncbi:MAG: hypothetical protein JSR17_08750 [Proteobacteria bacterium]|nr:hypothetical protein [Pseudomonadota bacterium]